MKYNTRVRKIILKDKKNRSRKWSSHLQFTIHVTYYIHLHNTCFHNNTYNNPRYDVVLNLVDLGRRWTKTRMRTRRSRKWTIHNNNFSLSQTTSHLSKQHKGPSPWNAIAIKSKAIAGKFKKLKQTKCRRHPLSWSEFFSLSFLAYAFT